jgi:outer membrane protein OmpA-like peptidoglycan-associated protein
VRKKDYLGTSEDVTTKEITVEKEIKINLSLAKKSKKPIHIPNIQYEFGRAELMEISKITIDTTVLRLMIANPELIIEIQSHTDSKGNDRFNEKLSQKRAESVVNYLITKGIDSKRLKPKGYGETKPVAPNEHADGSDNPEGRALNRRTDFNIIGVISEEEISEEVD